MMNNKDNKWNVGWLTAIINDDYSVEAWAEPDEFLFRVHCCDRDEAEIAASSFVNLFENPLICCLADYEDIKKMAVAANHQAKFWRFESFDNESMNDFMNRIEHELPQSHNYLLHLEGDINPLAGDIACIDVPGEPDFLDLTVTHKEDLEYKALTVFAFKAPT